MFARVDLVADLGFDKAFAFLRTLVEFDEIEREHLSRSDAVYSTSVISWMLEYQRLNPDRSLEEAVKQLIENPPDLSPENVRIREGTLSSHTGRILWRKRGCRWRLRGGLRSG